LRSTVPSRCCDRHHVDGGRRVNSSRGAVQFTDDSPWSALFVASVARAARSGISATVATGKSHLVGEASANSRFRNPMAQPWPLAVTLSPSRRQCYGHRVCRNGNDGTVSSSTEPHVTPSMCRLRADGADDHGRLGPVDDAVDQRTDTVYVTTSVATGLGHRRDTCNAHNHSGCHRTPPTITVGNIPDGVAIDEATHTVYVANVVTTRSP